MKPTQQLQSFPEKVSTLIDHRPRYETFKSIRTSACRSVLLKT